MHYSYHSIAFHLLLYTNPTLFLYVNTKDINPLFIFLLHVLRCLYPLHQAISLT